MLVLQRYPGQRIVISIDGEVVATVKVNAINRGKVSLGIDAPAHVNADREEVHERIIRSQRGANQPATVAS